ncbi:ribosomal protein S2, partial [Neoconidiobolus thromboides FSU 785]
EQPEEFNPTELTMAKMLASGLHLGSSTELWNPKNLPFIFGSRADINIFNLEATMSYLKRACAFTREVAFNNGIILFLSSKPEFASATVKAAQRSNSYYVYHKWVPGAISNRESVLGSKSFVYYEGEQIEYKNYKPDLLIVANYQDNKKAIAEATRYNIPTIAIIDSDQDPAGVTYPIPGNDDSVKGIELVFGLLSTAARDGMAKREYLAKKEVEKESK